MNTYHYTFVQTQRIYDTKLLLLFSCSVMSDSATPWTAACQASLSIITSWSLLKLMSIKSVMPSNHLILCHPLLLLPSIFPSIRVFFNDPDGQSTGAAASASVLPMNIQDWFPLGLTGWISLQSKGFSKVFPNTTVQKHQFFGPQLSLWPNSHIHTTTEKTITLTRWTFVGKVMSLHFNMLSRLVITSLPRSKPLLISWLQSPSTVIWKPKKVCHCFHYFPIYLPWSDGTRCHDLGFLNVSFKPTFLLSSFTFIKRLFSSSLLP